MGHTQLRYEIFVTVWGKHYGRMFVDFAFASQLAPGNIPALSGAASVTYRIYTDRESVQYFQPEIKVLNAFVALEFIFFEV